MLVYDAVTYGPLSWELSFKLQNGRHLAVGITGEWAGARGCT